MKSNMMIFKFRISSIFLIFNEISDKFKSLNINNPVSLELWEVDGKKVEINGCKLEGFSTEDDIKNVYGVSILS
jgi:hypothetical protein